jgi:hypothetical protein
MSGSEPKIIRFYVRDLSQVIEILVNGPGCFSTLNASGNVNFSRLPVAVSGAVPDGLVAGDLYLNNGAVCSA